jgi:putative transposase
MDAPVRRRTADLRKGRTSLSSARYFITVCLARPASALNLPACAETVVSVVRRLENDADIRLHAATVMPDHVHLLGALGERLSLGRVVSKLKGLTNGAVGAAGGRWQENFFDHRLRPEAEADAFARYIFLNPYRAGLVSRDRVWPYWICGSQKPAFVDRLEAGRLPPPAWIDEPSVQMGLTEDAVGPD